ncbi:hypothetical protein AVO42_02335 [Thiomicrospira sp. XS5]|jgi:hypothetical protein|uniref:DUF3302 domain-containing protein n=1 Tax=Thiomicrospira sp. XS5 TaxID=1775636 RepID=UPI000746477F|nr:DUF3302 domain-containing protein [Thiomicrospira sp. XS5]KUJ74273.1 hypothetical protein AVO42_02335 [Thiomicrospira sp. XS5]
MHEFLNYFSLFLLFFVVVVLFYGIIAIHDIPYKIAKKRNHPHQDAIEAAGWVSLFMLHVLWPFLWIWAMTYREERGWGFQSNTPASDPNEAISLAQLQSELSALQNEVRSLKGDTANGGQD